jgi:hypothetical protein
MRRKRWRKKIAMARFNLRRKHPFPTKIRIWLVAVVVAVAFIEPPVFEEAEGGREGHWESQMRITIGI